MIQMRTASLAALLFTVAATPVWGKGDPAVAPSVVAEAAGDAVAVYHSPYSKKPFLHIASPTGDGLPAVFLVKSRRIAGWEQVYLPRRPNGSTGWVKDGAVSLALDPYRVRVSLGRHRVTVWKGSRIVLDEPAGVGRSVLPTPRGTYYIVSLLKQPNPYGLYGPYAFGLSAFSNVLYNFGSGPGEIGLHGTDDPAALGTDVSHGCIRISNAAITRLASLLPLGTPVRIVS
ncbi:MAG TPA: L,D-transpeptidase [Gaiellaceae bacterium]|nr:L,D-transpeptidase [Gaiellaceae bacterium]